MTSPNLSEELSALYAAKMDEIRQAAADHDTDLCLNRANAFLGFMNRFRNCNLEHYFDEELHRIILGLNQKRYDTSHLLKPKKEFRIAFVFNRFNDTGGAAFTHRYLLEKYATENVSFKQYVLITNTANETDYTQYERYQYMKANIEVEDFHFIEANDSVSQKAETAQQWLHDNQIDFAIFQPSPLTLYALASQPSLITATFSADCHVFTIGPGTGDFTYYVINDQVYKYRYADKGYDERKTKNVLLPLPPQEYINDAEPTPRSELGVPDDAIVSATTNMWKCTFGDTEILLEGIARLMRRHPNYHHLFLGTPRGLDSLEYFLQKNPDLKGRIKFAGSHPYIYKVLKSLDFFVNSFPVSGATNTETAAVGKPSIDLFSHRDMSFHNTEFLRSNECAVTSLDAFVKLGDRLITDKAYRDDLGIWLKGKVTRDLDKNIIAKEEIYDAFVDEFHRRLNNEDKMPALGVGDTIDQELHLAFYSAHARQNWDAEQRWALLTSSRAEFPDRPFGWVCSLEEVIRCDNAERFEEIETSLTEELRLDTRIKIMLALAYEHFGNHKRSLECALAAAENAVFDPRAPRTAARIALAHGDLANAVKWCKVASDTNTVDEGNVAEAITKLPNDALPLYYNF